MLRSIVTAITLSLTLAPVAQAQTDESIVGAHAVTFEPTQVGGTLVGCALVYRAVQFEGGGNPVLAVGNIGINQTGRRIGVTLKVGVRGLSGDTPFVSPNFAYIQTKNASTAKVKQVGQEVEKGFRYTVYSFYDPTVQQVVNEMIESRKVTIAFNRTVNGLDVRIPIDLDVIDTTYPGGNAVVRVRSKQTMSDFLDCFLRLIDQAESSLKKK